MTNLIIGVFCVAFRGTDATVDPSHRKAMTPFQQWGRYSDQTVPTLALPKLEVISSLDTWAQENLLPLLKPVQNSWQPQDFLPDASSEDFLDEVMELRQRAKALPDDYWVCLVGDAITEEALPTYQTWLNNLEGVRDNSGCDPTPWAVWTRGWTAEENRHGDLLNRYLFLSGRVDMRMIERTIQYLIGSGVVCLPPIHPTQLQQFSHNMKAQRNPLKSNRSGHFDSVDCDMCSKVTLC